MLAAAGCQLVVHGHKHHPRFTYYSSAVNSRLPVLAAGSFSAILNRIESVTRNVFHIVDLALPQPGRDSANGTVLTWEWKVGTGWIPSSLQSADFPHVAGFGAQRTPSQIAVSLILHCNAAGNSLLEYQALLAIAPEICHLIPSELVQLRGALSQEGMKLFEDAGQWCLGIPSNHDHGTAR